MPKCVYCLKDETQTSFNSREHIIPSSMGKFVPLNPTIKGDIVCDACNTKIFSPLETNFIEDTYEGVMSKMLNLDGSGSVRICGKNFKIEQISGLGEDFFDEMFYFLKWENNKIVVDLKRQIKLRNYDGGFQVFLPEAMERIKKDSSKFNEVKANLKKLKQKDIQIFAESPEAIKEIIELLKGFGINYKERESKGRPLSPNDKLELKQDYACKIDKNIARVFAKIAFNYFSYCAMQDNMEEILYGSEFDETRQFILTGNNFPLKKIIPSINEEPILLEERTEGKRLIAHLINFLKDNGNIVTRMTFFGLPAIYKIVLGPIPPGLNKDSFGCGHAFSPFTREIYNLAQRQLKNPTENDIRLSFGLFKRTRIA